MTAITLPADLEAWARAEVEALVAEALRERRAEYVRGKLDEARASAAAGTDNSTGGFPEARRGEDRPSSR